MPCFDWPIRVYYEDTDAGGVVYHANYLHFFERARTEWLRALGFEQDQLRQQQQSLFVVRQLHIDYLQPAHFNQLLNTQTQLTHLGKASFSVQQHLFCQDQLLCQLDAKIVCVHEQKRRPCAIPTNVLEELNTWL